MAQRVKLRQLTAEEREAVNRLSRSRTVESRQAERIKIVRLASQGCGTTQIANQVGVTRPRVLDWMKRFNEQGLAGLDDLPRSGRPATYSVEEISTVVATSLTPPDRLYTQPPENSAVMCLDEMGPVAAKTFAGQAG